MDSDDLISTDENIPDSDTEYPVKQILAQGQVFGRKQYLVEWEGFPLYDATWEPKEHFQQGQRAILKDWELKKKRQREGKTKSFDIDEWRNAKIQHLREKWARHVKRNKKRKRLGLKCTSWPRALEDLITEIKSVPSDQPGGQRNPEGEVDGALLTKEKRVRPRSQLERLFSDSESNNDNDASDFEATSCQSDAEPTSQEERQGDVTIPNTAVVPEQVARQLPEIFAGIAIEPACDRSNAREPDEPPNLAQQNETGAAMDDLGSDAMDIDGTDGDISPFAPSLPSPTKQSFATSDEVPIEASVREFNGLQSSSAALKKTDTAVEEKDKTEPDGFDKDTSLEDADQQKSDGSKPTAPESKKKGKRVSFSFSAPSSNKDEDHVETSLFVSDNGNSQDLPPSHSHSSPEMNNGRDQPPERNMIDDSLPKTCTMGAMKLTGSFHVSSTLRQSDVNWYRKISSAETLRFSHICTAQDFIRQMRAGELSETGWVAGTVCSDLQSSKLEVLLNYLQSSSLGLLRYEDHICLLLYPAKSDDWQQSPLPVSAVQPGHLLRYLVFVPSANFKFEDLSLDFSHSYPSGIEIFDKQVYQKLLPPSDHVDRTAHPTDNFFLIFPPSAKPEEDLICRWLRIFNRNCEIRSSTVAGHWAKFVEGARGAVILHQDCLQALHRMPRLAKLLHSKNEDYNFWIFRLPFCAPISQPRPLDNYLDQVGIALDFVFPHGVAVMATPSFFLSQPMQAYNLLKWVWQNFSEEAPLYRQGKLVVCHDAAEWLFSLAIEKSQEESGPRESDKFLEVRMKMVMLLRKLLDQADDDDVTQSIVCAPAYIDGNDEQSLVNWFGWWSTTQIDHFRKSTIVCSDNDDDTRFSRHLSRPALRGLFAEANSVLEAASGRGLGSFSLVPSDSVSDLTQYLRGVYDRAHSGGWNPLAVCPWPIGQHAGKSRFGDAGQWVKFFLERHIEKGMNGKHSAVMKNTQLGFFYLKEAAGSEFDGGERWPWLALIRPAELHRRPWRSTELLIWDYRLRDLARESSTLSESDLSSSQRHLIEEVTQQYAKIDLPLGKVWAGGFKASKLYTNPLDITLDWMSAAVTNIKSWLPLNHDDMLNRGWSFVRSHVSQSTPHSPIKSRGSISGEAAADSALAAQEGKMRIVFEPPYGDPSAAISCPNRLHQWVMAQRVESESKYTFIPTLDWYNEQYRAGRGFEHIRVWSWRRFFEHYKIDDPEGEPTISGH